MQGSNDSEQINKGPIQKKMNYRSVTANHNLPSYMDSYDMVSRLPFQSTARGSAASIASSPIVKKAQEGSIPQFQRKDLPLTTRDTFATFSSGGKLQDDDAKKRSLGNLPSRCIEDYAKYSLLPAFAGAGVGNAAVLRSQNEQVAQKEKVASRDSIEEEFQYPDRYTKNGRKRAVSFPLKLMKILETKAHSNIVTWMPNGRSFKIIRPTSFKSKILPLYFKGTKYASFKRKLHRWGFERSKMLEEAERDDWFGSEIYYNPLFQRGRFDLVDKMACHEGKKPKDSVVEEPSPQELRPRLELPTDIDAAARSQQMHLPLPSLPASSLQRPLSLAQAHMPLPQQLEREDLSTMSTAALDAAIDDEVTRRLTSLSNPKSVIEAEISRRINERIEAEILRESIAAEAMRERVEADAIRETIESGSLARRERARALFLSGSQVQPHQNINALSSSIDHLLNSRRQELSADIAALRSMAGCNTAGTLPATAQAGSMMPRRNSKIDRIAAFRINSENDSKGSGHKKDHANTA